MELLRGDKVLASVSATPAPNQWQTVNTSLALPAGPQTIHIRCTAKGQTINWIGFTKQ